jgi:branched-chain amino acid transport system permease protein
LETVIGGVMVGVLYALVGLGFVLIYKASGVFNYAQGAMVLVGGLALARFSGWVPQWLGISNRWLALLVAFVLAYCVMVLIAVLVEKLVLRHLVNQSPISLLLATLGVSCVLDGLAQITFGSDVYALDLGLPRQPLLVFQSVIPEGVLIGLDDLMSAAIAGALVLGLTLWFRYTSTGRALRAVADDHQAAQSIGIPLGRMWITVWSVAGLVALVAGAIWGSKLGVQFSLATIALKAIPVVMLGGFTSVPGAVMGGLIIGVGEKLADMYVGPLVGSGLETWFAYAIALSVLLLRPQGLFGDKVIDRV